MERARFTKGQHDPSCSGCPVCSDEMARVLRMGVAEYSAWLRGRSQELACRGSIRVVPDQPRTAREAALDLPDTYGLAALMRARRSAGTPGAVLDTFGLEAMRGAR